MPETYRRALDRATARPLAPTESALDAAPAPLIGSPSPRPQPTRAYEAPAGYVRRYRCNEADSDPDHCYRERGHLDVHGFAGIGGESFGESFGYGYGLRGAARIADVVEVGLAIARFQGDSSASTFAVLPQVNAVLHDDRMRTTDVYVGGQVGFMRRRFDFGSSRKEFVDMDGLAFGAQVGLAIHFPPSFALRFELAWLHINEVTHDAGYGVTYFATSADMADLQLALCLTF